MGSPRRSLERLLDLEDRLDAALAVGAVVVDDLDARSTSALEALDRLEQVMAQRLALSIEYTEVADELTAFDGIRAAFRGAARSALRSARPTLRAAPPASV